jgi:malic enzyme
LTHRLTMSDTWEGEAMPIYQIRLKEQLDQHWSAWFGGLMVTIKANGETLLTGEVVDQAAPHRLLSKVHDLQLTLISVYSLVAVVTGGSSMLRLANIGLRAGLPVMEGKAAGARVVTTGRSDYPNQVNNTLVFLGLFRGGLDVRARLDNEAMKIVAAVAQAAMDTGVVRLHVDPHLVERSCRDFFYEGIMTPVPALNETPRKEMQE